MIRRYSSLITFILTLSFSCQPSKDEVWTPLFNGRDLAGWDTYLGPVFDPETNEQTDSIPGLNYDPTGVFSIVEMDGENVIRISGEGFGGISTKEEYENYHLSLQFRWGTAKHAPRKNQKRDSGLLYHSVGPHGADYGYWMRSQEFQIQEGDCGDYWGVAGGVFDIRAEMGPDSLWVYNPDADLVTFSEKSPVGRWCIKYPDNENPTGKWNTLELFVIGGSALHVVNGKVVMVLENSRQLDGESTISLTKGKIQIQSEGAEVYYKNIKVRGIEKLPELELNSEM